MEIFCWGASSKKIPSDRDDMVVPDKNGAFGPFLVNWSKSQAVF